MNYNQKNKFIPVLYKMSSIDIINTYGLLEKCFLQERNKKIRNDVKVLKDKDDIVMTIPKGSIIDTYYSYFDESIYIKYNHYLFYVIKRDLRKKVIYVDDIIDLSKFNRISNADIVYIVDDNYVLMLTLKQIRDLYYNNYMIIFNHQEDNTEWLYIVRSSKIDLSRLVSSRYIIKVSM